MNYFDNRLDGEIVRLIKAGGIGVLKTDTLYGIVASVANRTAVERVYAARHRSAHKASIILIGDESQLLLPAPDYSRHILEAHWPGPVSIILPVDETIPEWLHRGEHSLAYRLPEDDELRALLLKTGPIIAPSANLEGQTPAQSVTEAMDYFGDQVDFYVDSGVCENTNPSKIIKIGPDGTVTQLR